MPEATPPPVPAIRHRNVALYTILTIVTLGLFGIYWFVTLTNDANTISCHPEKMGGVSSFLLVLVTCGIWSFVWAYNLGNEIDEAKTLRGIPPSGNTGALYVVLSLAGCFFFTQIPAQSELNRLAAA